MTHPERRTNRLTDRRGAPRGGRRPSDRGGRTPTILLADGHASARSVYARFLDRYHFHTETAATPDEVSASLNRTRPAVVLIEAELGGVAVWEMAEWPALQDVPVIVLAGGSGDGLSEHGAFSPAAILRKPFELSTMLEVVRATLRTRPAG